MGNLCKRERAIAEKKLWAGELTKQSKKAGKWSHNGDGEKEDDEGDEKKGDDNTL